MIDLKAFLEDTTNEATDQQLADKLRALGEVIAKSQTSRGAIIGWVRRRHRQMQDNLRNALQSRDARKVARAQQQASRWGMIRQQMETKYGSDPNVGIPNQAVVNPTSATPPLADRQQAAQAAAQVGQPKTNIPMRPPAAPVQRQPVAPKQPVAKIPKQPVVAQPKQPAAQAQPPVEKDPTDPPEPKQPKI